MSGNTGKSGAIIFSVRSRRDGCIRWKHYPCLFSAGFLLFKYLYIIDEFVLCGNPPTLIYERRIQVGSAPINLRGR